MTVGEDLGSLVTDCLLFGVQQKLIPIQVQYRVGDTGKLRFLLADIVKGLAIDQLIIVADNNQVLVRSQGDQNFIQRVLDEPQVIDIVRVGS